MPDRQVVGGLDLSDNTIKFNDGAAYEQMMGVWSRLAGEQFLDWLAPGEGTRWVDIGCGNGCFTELALQRCAPAEIHGIDPSEGQLSFARKRTAEARFGLGSAEALPFPDDRFDVATMALVIFFVPRPIEGVIEMARVVRPGGVVGAYAWDMPGGGFPWEPVLAELRAADKAYPTAPNNEVSAVDAFRGLWAEAGLTDIESCEIRVERSFADFDEFWRIANTVSLGRAIDEMPPGDVEALKQRLIAKLTPDETGHITCSARANAVVGRVA